MKRKWGILTVCCLFILAISACNGPQPAAARLSSPIPPTPFPTAETPTASPAPTEPANQTMLLMMDFSPGFSLQQASGETARIPSSQRFTDFLGWQDAGCALLAQDEADNIVKIDLRGRLLETVFPFSRLETLDPDYLPGYTLHLSPDRRWLWYYGGSGQSINEMGPAIMETMNVRVIPLDGASGPHEISTRGGAWMVAAKWSPDGSLIAYTDLDEQHAQQVFVAAPDGSRRQQITRLTRPVFFSRELSVYDLPVLGFEWSPDGEKLAVTQADGSNRGVSIYALDGSRAEIRQPGSPAQALWWIDNQRLVVFSEQEGQAGIYVVNSQSGAVEQQLLESDYPAITQVHPYQTASQIGFFSLDDQLQEFIFYILDASTGQVSELPAVQRIEDLTGWWSAPVDFPGEEACAP